MEHGILPNTEKKRKRTSIAAPEKRLLEEFFRQQPRPTGDRISAIADKLDLKKNVVRVWFCNQRQKQKRSQFRSRNQNNQQSSSSNQSNGDDRKDGNESPNNQDENTPSPASEVEVKCTSIQAIPVSLGNQTLQPQLNSPFPTLDINHQLRDATKLMSGCNGQLGGGSAAPVGNIFYHQTLQQ